MALPVKCLIKNDDRDGKVHARVFFEKIDTEIDVGINPFEGNSIEEMLKKAVILIRINGNNEGAVLDV